MVRVLIAEDSDTARALLVEILRTDPTVEIVGEARDGLEAVAMTERLRPDVVTMDIHMPRLDGFGATKEIMIACPTPIVVVSGTDLAAETETAARALAAGALAIIPRPSVRSDNFRRSARELVSMVKSMAGIKVIRRRRDPDALVRRPLPARQGSVRAVAIAASTGGPAALHAILRELPATLPVPLLAVQHITPGFIGGLVRWLSSASAIRVKLAEDGEPLLPGTLYLAPDGSHLGIAPGVTVSLSGAPPIGGFRPSADHLFESLGRVFGARGLGVILTGMGADGLQGLKRLREARGAIVAQDETSCVVYGMPGVAVAAGLADAVLPLEAIARRIVTLATPTVDGLVGVPPTEQRR
ncbi:MAG: two-component system, chemotaxis family, protein-glutamate methylesterase/glutaminase [Candidatus Binatota bacterium]|jgi:two-component system chemotaxis response regulator CheB|nr:two-component system, chemotaxis family, protein-glutamate methylesterase/glutaminase [Candidatus Binatota bacterium]